MGGWMPSSLGDNILAAFKAARERGRLDVAEHLLSALEALESRPRPGSALGRGYLTIAGKGARPDRRMHG